MDPTRAPIAAEYAFADIIASHADAPGALLPILHDLQAAFGFVPETAVEVVADALNLSRAEVQGVVSFYPDFRRAPPERPVIRLCRAEACQARGVLDLVPLAEADERVSLETVYCLGLCASGPAAMVGDQVFARLDAAALARLIDEAAS